MLSDKQKVKIYERFITAIASATNADDLLQLHIKALYWKNANIAADEVEYTELVRKNLIKSATIRLNL